jgi:hypothetical protein
MTLATLAAVAPARADECVIKSVKSACFEAIAIGYGGGNTRVVVVELTLENAGDQPMRLNWKNAIPLLEAEGRRIEASRLLVPNWLPIAGGVGPYATEMSCGGKEIKGFLEIEKDTWCAWLAIDKPGAESGDHVSTPVESATVTVTKGKAANIKLLFPEDMPLSGAKIVVPGCKPSLFPVGDTAQSTAAHGAANQPTANRALGSEEYVVVACGGMTYRLSLTGSQMLPTLGSTRTAK